MLKSRPIRLAVNLCVIGALLLSPGGLAIGATGACDAKPGCDCCSAEAERTGCCCCCSKRLKQTAPRKSCCQSDPVAPNSDQGDEDSSSGDCSVCLCGADSRPATPPAERRADSQQLIKLSLATVAALVEPEDSTKYGSRTAAYEPPYLLPRDALRLLLRLAELSHQAQGMSALVDASFATVLC